MRWLVLFALGCGRIEFDPRADAPTLEDGAPVVCWSAWASGVPALEAPVLIAELDLPGIEHDMTLTEDGLHLYFSSDRVGTLGGDDIWLATRTNRSAPFTSVEHVVSLSSNMNEGPFFTRDGLWGVVAGSYPGGQGFSDLWLAQRDAIDQPFTVSQDGLALLNTSGPDYDSWFSTDRLVLYYASQQEVLTATRTSTLAAWGTPVAVPGINTGAEWDPSLSEDGRTIVFSSNRLAPERDIFAATRPTTSDVFGAAQPLSILNSAESEFDPHVAPDGCEIYFASDRGRSPGDLTLYVSRVIL